MVGILSINLRMSDFFSCVEFSDYSTSAKRDLQEYRFHSVERKNFFFVGYLFSMQKLPRSEIRSASMYNSEAKMETPARSHRTCSSTKKVLLEHTDF